MKEDKTKYQLTRRLRLEKLTVEGQVIEIVHILIFLVLELYIKHKPLLNAHARPWKGGGEDKGLPQPRETMLVLNPRRIKSTTCSRRAEVLRPLVAEV